MSSLPACALSMSIIIKRVQRHHLTGAFARVSDSPFIPPSSTNPIFFSASPRVIRLYAPLYHLWSHPLFHPTPYRPCPHCDAPLLSLFARTALITQLEEQRAYTLAEEAAQREREAEALRQAEGAFPTLNAAATGTTTIANSTAARGAHTGSGTGGGAMTTTTTTGASHRVLSLDAQTGRVRVIESYSTRSATLRSHETERGVDVAEAVVPPPPKEVEYVHVQRERATRWVDFKGDGGAKYVAPPPVHRAPQSERAGGKGKGKARERVVPSEAA
ncbi:hypothetical protein B0F90DRAFT_963965 [Multifurca ochricompacta]|uniref:Uncharacterized protein n=1 Tax=Multifurca ochricompacta TaxID=376703 RepID=A0AAD4QR93_9AGAM|nr:hypothetical protein B0F90DRAFT_963965 [Multifurca ochricompacta]